MNESSARFDQHADRYATSALHQDSPTLRRLHELVALPTGASVCDVACGPGPVALSFAPRASRIVGVDPAPRMLAAFGSTARDRGVTVECVEAYADSIPLASASFDLVTCRLAAHHFADVGAAVSEMARLARSGGQVAVIDLVGYDDPVLDEFNHALECLHDPTHVRSHRASRWRDFLVAAGLVVERLEPHCERPQGITIARWCQTTAPGAESERRIRLDLSRAPRAHLEALGIRAEGDEFLVTSRTVLALARKP